MFKFVKHVKVDSGRKFARGGVAVHHPFIRRCSKPDPGPGFSASGLGCGWTRPVGGRPEHCRVLRGIPVFYPFDSVISPIVMATDVPIGHRPMSPPGQKSRPNVVKLTFQPGHQDPKVMELPSDVQIFRGNG